MADHRPGRTAEVAAALRARPDADPAQVLVRDETAAELLGDPLGAGPNAALMAVAAAAAALAAVGFAVGSAGAMRERSAEFGVLRALGTPQRRLARLIAAEQGLLIGIGLLVGIGLGSVLARAVVPLVVLTGQAARPVPPVLVELPSPRSPCSSPGSPPSPGHRRHDRPAPHGPGRVPAPPGAS